MSLVNVLPIREALFSFTITMVVAGAFAYQFSHADTASPVNTPAFQYASPAVPKNSMNRNAEVSAFLQWLMPIATDYGVDTSFDNQTLGESWMTDEAMLSFRNHFWTRRDAKGFVKYVPLKYSEPVPNSDGVSYTIKSEGEFVSLVDSQEKLPIKFECRIARTSMSYRLTDLQVEDHDQFMHDLFFYRNAEVAVSPGRLPSFKQLHLNDVMAQLREKNLRYVPSVDIASDSAAIESSALAE